MRDYNSILIALGPWFQIFRGLLFGGILLLIPSEFFMQKFSWLKLWAVVAGIGIINTPGPGLGSIEGLIYTTIPLKSYLGCIEVFIQTLWFSWWVCRQKKDNKISLFTKMKFPLIASAICLFGISLSGLLIGALKGLDPMTGAQDPYAMLVVLLSAVIVFIITIWYLKKMLSGQHNGSFTVNTAIYLSVCFLANGIFALIYNLAFKTQFQSPLTVLFAVFLTFLNWLFICRKINS
jgi:hypothetical protein